MARSGFLPMTTAEGLAMFDAAIASGHPLVVPARIDTAALTASGLVPAIARLIARSRRRASNEESAQQSKLSAQLHGHNETEQDRITLEFVRGQVALVLGHDTPQTIPPEEPFKNLGFDSLSAVEFRNRLQTATGLKIPATIVFDYPTPKALAQYLRTQVAPQHTADTDKTELSESDLRSLLSRLPIDIIRNSGIAEIARALADRHAGNDPVEPSAGKAIEDLDANELIDLAMGPQQRV